MVGIVNAGAVLLGFDLTLEIACDALELCDHHLDLCHPPAPLIDLKPLQADEASPSLHRLVLPRSPTATHDERVPPKRPAVAQCADRILVFRSGAKANSAAPGVVS